jgi:hypothetical protein
MHLIKVAPDEALMLPGYEKRTLECSGCRQHVQRLAFIPHAIAPLTGERMRFPPAWRKSRIDGATVAGVWSRALHAAPRAKAMSIAGTLILIGLAGSTIMWSQALKGPRGDQGPPGAKGQTGDPGPAGAASGIRILRSNCDETACRVQCGESEMLLTAYCGPKRNAAIIATERAATCRAAGPANNHLVAVCAQIAP